MIGNEVISVQYVNKKSILLFWKQKQTILLRNNYMKIGKRTFEIKGYQY